MSYYYNYTIGYIQDGKIYPWGPYSAKGALCDVVSKSRSFASDLHERFMPVKPAKVSDELRKAFEYNDWDEKIKMQDVRYLPVRDLPNGDYRRKGYFLIDHVMRYEQGDDIDVEDMLYECLTPTAYAEKLKNELALGEPKPKLDCEGEPFPVHSAAEYMYYAVPDYSSEEYEASVLRDAASMLYDYKLENSGAEMVILETEG